jgi:hypothetical protein
MGAERVDSIAARHKAIAAVNAGFFNVKNGEPAGLLKVGGELVSDTGLTRGVVAIHSPEGRRQQFYFDQVAVRVIASFSTTVTPTDVQEVQIDGVGTTRERGRLMLFTPMYAPDTETATNGTEWVIGGDPPVVTQIRRDLGRTAIPRDGAVLSYGGLDPPSPLDWLLTGTVVRFRSLWRVVNDTPPDRFEEARDVINGAGLLKRGGQTMANWVDVENLQAETFTDVRHPRTIIGVDRRGDVWLAAIDGRQVDHSIGMTFAELVGLADRLGLVDALNLDGGGSTTMVMEGKVVNRPSDAAGPRPVSDAIVILPRATATSGL